VHTKSFTISIDLMIDAWKEVIPNPITNKTDKTFYKFASRFRLKENG